MENNSFEYETPISSLRRLIYKDNSDQFKIIINFDNINYIKSNLNSKINNDNQIEIETTINKARVISNRINTIYQIDPTITEYEINIPNQQETKKFQEYKKNVEETLELLIQSTMNKVEIRAEQVILFHQLHFLLGAEGSDEKGFHFSNEEEAISCLSTEMHMKSIEYLSDHFYEMINSGNYENLNENIMCEIIDHHFCNDVQSNKEEKRKRIAVFNKLKDENESPRIILSLLMRMNIDEYNEDIYSYLFQHLDDDFIEQELPRILVIIRKFLKSEIHKLKECDEANENMQIIKCEFQNDELSGIINYLKGNKSAEETLEEEFKLSGGGGIDSSRPITNLIKYNYPYINNAYYNKGFNHNTTNDSWIEFDFGEKKIKLTSYTIRSNNGKPNLDAHPKTWTISGSNDGKEWKVINKQVNNPSLNGKNKQHRFEIENNERYYRYIRYHQEDSWDENRKYQYAISLTCFELFGSILIPEDV